MKRPMPVLVLLLLLVVSACDDGIRAKLDHCKDEIRAELKDLLEETRHDATESLKALDPVPQPGEPVNQRSNEMIKAVPEMFAAMAVPMLEAQLQAWEATPADLAKCEAALADASRR